ncbi:MAG: hypothetical protein PHV11_03565 [Candidatus Bipolaricaulis sp.]|nr:hypothetical protein [Candidatus Bipolaricaulis sp.]MDD5219626.1 hypothetical protein [Candidatus Bipolaricaulis sp.]
MAVKTYAEAKSLLEREIKAMWLKKPRDVSNLSKVLGAFEQSGSVKIYADAETRGVSDALTRLRVIHQSKAVDTAAMSKVAGGVLAAYAEQWPRYYRFQESSKVIGEVAECLKTPITNASELDEILKLAIRYVYRLCFWIDTEIPWKAVTDLFR